MVPVLCFGQTFKDFKYITLESNDYGIDITTIATEIFSKKGFIVLEYNSTPPNDLKKETCNILTAKINYKRGKTGYTASKLKLALLDCENKEIYYKESKNTTNFNQPDVLNNFIKATNGIPTIKRTVINNNYNNPKKWAGNGSGIIISKSGYIITNHHVIDAADDIEVEFILNGEVQKFNAEIIQSDKVNDLAVIKIVDVNFDGVKELPYSLKTRSSDVGTKVYAFGYPMALSIMGKEIKVTDGIISSKTGFDGDITTYQISAPIQGGNSGGPLFDDKGNFIGVNSSGINKKLADNVGYSIKTSYVLNLIDILPKSIELPSNKKLATLPLTEQIKEITKYVVLVKVK